MKVAMPLWLLLIIAFCLFFLVGYGAGVNQMSDPDRVVIQRYENLLMRLANEGQAVTVWTNTGRVVREDGERGRLFKVEFRRAEEDERELVERVNARQGVFRFRESK